MVPLVQPVPLALDRGLYPDLEWGAEEFLEFDNFDSVGYVPPIVVQADNAITFLRVVSVRIEDAR